MTCADGTAGSVADGGSTLILAPRGRDAAVVSEVLARHGVPSAICGDLSGIAGQLTDEVCCLLLTEEALWGPSLPALMDWLGAQPPWSDLPVILLATRQPGPRQGQAAKVLAGLGNVVLLERPVNAETLASAVLSARRGRQRQYQTRALLLEQARIAADLQALNGSLNERVEERARELDRTREVLSFTLDAAGMGSWDVDLTEGVIRRSPQHDRIFGFSAPPGDGGRVRLLSHVVEEDRDLAMARLEAALHEGSLDLECRIRREDGVQRWVAARGRVTYGISGAPTRMAGVIMDVTERHDTEDALRQAQKMEAIGQLTGGVAHDFNNLLTVIVGGLDMVIRRPEQTERVVRLARAAMSAARRGEQLTQQLLAFSRRQMLRPEVLDPNALLRGFEPLASRAVGETVALRLELAPGVGAIRVDPAQFESAVLNLMVNARDAMPDGGSLVVRTRNLVLDGSAAGSGRAAEGAGGSTGGGNSRGGAGRALARGRYVSVSVTDTGTGIEPAILARAFEPFFTTKEVGRGSGLGLSQVYGFTRSAGGTVEIESEVGRGTTVRLIFPLSTEAASLERQAPVEAKLRQATSGETVLLVEDDEQVLAMAVDSLEEMHYRVMVARNAHEALAHLSSADRIDIMFSDVVMPGGMNGAQLAAEAKSLRPALKILLTSGYVGGQGGQGGGPAEAVQEIDRDMPVLTKPYRRDELARTLRMVLAEG